MLLVGYFVGSMFFVFDGGPKESPKCEFPFLPRCSIVHAKSKLFLIELIKPF